MTASFLFMWLQLFWRERVVYFRNPMKLAGALLNAIVGIIIVGVFFVNEIPSEGDLLALGQVLPTFEVSQIFLGIQGVSFINITSMIMTGIFTVQLACTLNPMQSPPTARSTTSRPQPRSTGLSPTSSPKSSWSCSTSCWALSSSAAQFTGSTATTTTSPSSSNIVRNGLCSAHAGPHEHGWQQFRLLHRCPLQRR